MNLIDLLQMTKPQAAQQQSEGLGPIMQFLAQSRAPQMPAIQMPQGSKYGPQILAQSLQKQYREDTYAAHLQAKNDMEQQQAQAIVGHEAELSDDPQVQAMLKSGNPQLVNYAMKIAEDEKQKKIASQYNENATFALYDKLMQEGTKESLAKAARIMEFKKAGANSVNIDTADKYIKPQDMANITDAEGNAVRIPAGTKFGDPGMQGVYMGQPRTTDEKQAGVFFEGLENGLANMKKVLPGLNLNPGLNKEYAASVAANSGIPIVEDIGQANQSEQRQMYDQARSQIRQEAIHLISQGAFTVPEIEEVTSVIAPGWGDKGDVPITKIESLEKIISAARQRAGRNAKVINPSRGAYNNLITDEMYQDGFANIIGKVENPKMDPNAVSPKGAFGLAQTMPDTFREMMPDGDPSNPAHQIEAGHRYWKQALAASNGDLKRAAAYYQGGPGGMAAFDEGIYRNDGNLNTKQYGDQAFGPSPGPRKELIDKPSPGTKADTAKQQRDYNAGLKERALNASSKNSPRNEARRAALEARANKLRAAQ